MNFKEFQEKLNNNLEVFSIGKSVLGKEVWACHVGKTETKQILIQAGIHAREYVTSLLAVSQAERLLEQNLSYGVYFVLCSNPDGAEIVLDGFSNLDESLRLFCEQQNFDHKLFKANANLVDLNTNFDALWGQGKNNRTDKHFENFIGECANSEIEVQNLINFTNFVQPSLTLSYHTKGEVIYYGFDTQSPSSLERDQEIGLKLSDCLDFPLHRSFNSCGGYKDWVCDKLDIPSFTIELGEDKLSHPLDETVLPDLEQKSENLFLTIEDLFLNGLL